MHERAGENETTVAQQRAGQRETTAGDERADVLETSEESERAGVSETTDKGERAGQPETSEIRERAELLETTERRKRSDPNWHNNCHRGRKSMIAPPEQLGLAFESALDRQFREFHEAHPEVYEELVSLARSGVARGRPRLGIKMLFEVVRWHRIIAGIPDPDESFKLNNNYHSRYARLIMQNEPDLRGIFETRELRT